MKGGTPGEGGARGCSGLTGHRLSEWSSSRLEPHCPWSLAAPMDLRRSHVMSWLSLGAPALIFTWQLLWPPVMAAQPLELALDPVRLTSDPPAPTEPWFLNSSDLPSTSPHVFTTPADLGSVHFLGSSAAAQVVASPQELTEPVVPFPDAAGKLPPGPDQFAAGLQDPEDKVTQHHRLPEVVPKRSWDQNQAVTLPPPLEIQTVGLDQAHYTLEIPVPPLGSASSKPAKLIVSPPHWSKIWLSCHACQSCCWNSRPTCKHASALEQLQDDYLDPSMGGIDPEEKLPVDFRGMGQGWGWGGR